MMKEQLEHRLDYLCYELQEAENHLAYLEAVSEEEDCDEEIRAADQLVFELGEEVAEAERALERLEADE
jgi:hypothetical protein